MQFLSAIKPFIPQPHAFLGEDRNYNVGVTFVDDLGLTDRHNVSLRYVRTARTLLSNVVLYNQMVLGSM